MKKIIYWFVGVVDIIAVVGLIALYIIEAHKTAIVTINLIPQNANVIIDGNVFSSGTIKTFPTEASIATISAPGFISKEIEVNLDPDRLNIIHAYLLPEDDNKNYYMLNSSDLEGLSFFNDSEAQKIVHITSIRGILPIVKYIEKWPNGTSGEIRINEIPDCDEYFCLQVVGDKSANHEASSNLIRDKGYNVKDYGVKYVES